MTSVTKTFVAANGTQLPTYDANFTTVGNALAGTFIVQSNSATSPVAGGSTLFFNTYNLSFANDQFSQITIGTVGGASQFFGISVRGSSGNGYQLIVDAGNWRLYKTVAFALTVLDSGTFTLSGGDIIKLIAASTSITAMRNTTVLTSVTDSAHASGQPGVASTSESGVGAQILGNTWIGSDEFGFGSLLADSRNRLIQ